MHPSRRYDKMSSHPQACFFSLYLYEFGGHSGYMRDVADTHLLLHEVVAERRELGCSLWVCFGDLEKAFPKTWRAVMLKNLEQDAGMCDGMYGLLGSILQHDRVHVNICGSTIVVVEQGVAEGGVIGPLAFPSYMEGLTLHTTFGKWQVFLLNMLICIWLRIIQLYRCRPSHFCR